MSIDLIKAIGDFTADTNVCFDIHLLKSKNCPYSSVEKIFYKKLCILNNIWNAWEHEFFSYADCPENINVPYNSWKMNSSKYEKYKNMHLNFWRNGKQKVYVLNQSKYYTDCKIQLIFISKSEMELNNFMKDQNLNLQIKTNQPIVNYNI